MATTSRRRVSASRRSGPSRAPRVSGLEVIFLLGIALGQIYYFYRYAFKYSDPGTSPTYGSTPTVFQDGKYALFALLFGAGIVLLLRRPKRKLSLGLLPGLALLTYLMVTLTVLAKGSAPGSVSSLPKAWFFLPLVALMPYFWTGRTSAERFLRVTMWLAAYNVIYEAVQLFLYYHSARLPALAYPNGGLVRFGGAIDDPNGFGTWLILPILALLAGWPRSLKPLPRVAALAILGYLLARTVSYSAFFGVIVGVAVLILLTRDTRKGVAAVIVGAAAAVLALESGSLTRIFHEKDASALSRLSFSATTTPGQSTVSGYFQHANVIDWLIGSPKNAPATETAYLALLMNFGLIVLVVVAVLIVATVIRGVRTVRLLRATQDRTSLAIYSSLTASFTALALCSFGVPLITAVFPTNFVFWSTAMMLWLPLRRSDAGEQERARVMQARA